MTTDAAIAVDDRYVAHNYSPLPVVAASAEGAWITDVEGRRYLDCLAAYSAVNFGHRNPEIIAAAHAQLDTVTLVSRAFHSDRLGPFCAGAGRAVRQGHGAADEQRRRGRRERHQGGPQVGLPTSRACPPGEGNIVVAHNNFHGRTTTIISFSDDETARRGFGPYTPGFRSVPFGDADALAAAIDDNTVAVLLEPIQGEAGIIVPPDDYLPRRARAVHRAQRADDRRRDPVRPGPHRAHLRLRPLGRGARHLPARQSPRRRRGSGVGGGGRPRHPRRAAPRRARLDLRRQPARRCDRHHGRGMLRRGEFQARSAELGERLHARLRRADRPRRGRGARHWGCGPASTSTRRWPPASRSA